jgi:hypothetical protein
VPNVTELDIYGANNKNPTVFSHIPRPKGAGYQILALYAKI